MGDTMGKRAGLAGACPGDDQERCSHVGAARGDTMGNRSALLRVPVR